MAYPALNTGKDLMEYCLAAGGQNPASTDDHATLVQASLTMAYWSILAWKQWTFAKAPTPKVLTTYAKNTGTCSISGTTVTLGTAIATSQTGRKFFLDANQTVYRISAHTGGSTSMTLDATYVEDITSGAFTIFQDEYALASDVIVPYGPFWLRGQFEGNVDLIDPTEFTARYGRNSGQSLGLVEAVAVIRDSQSGATQSPIVQIAPWSEDALNLEYEYADRHVLTYDGVAGTDTPKIPREFRWVMAEWALWLLFRKKSDDSIMPTDANVQSGLRMMETLYQSRANRPGFYARPRYSLGARS